MSNQMKLKSRTVALLVVVALAAPAVAQTVGDVEAARHNSRAGGVTNAHDKWLLQQYGEPSWKPYAGQRATAERVPSAQKTARRSRKFERGPVTKVARATTEPARPRNPAAVAEVASRNDPPAVEAPASPAEAADPVAARSAAEAIDPQVALMEARAPGIVKTSAD